MHRGHLERLVEGERRQDSRHAPGHHRFAGAGRTDEQQVVTAGRGDFERAPREQLSADVGEIGDCRGPRRRRVDRRRRQTRRIVEGAHGLGERRDRKDVQPRDDRRFAGVGCRQQHAGEAVAPGGDRDRQDPARGVDRSVERQLAEQHEIGDMTPLDDALGGEDAEGDRQVERRAGFAHVGRRQVDGDAVLGKLEARIADGAAHPVPALAHAGIGQADHREVRQAERHVDFDVDRTGFDAEDGGGPQAGEHGWPPAKVGSDRLGLIYQGVVAIGAIEDRRFCRTPKRRCVQGLPTEKQRLSGCHGSGANRTVRLKPDPTSTTPRSQSPRAV